MVRLLFVLHEKRWVDNSLRNLTGDWLRHAEERFAGVNGLFNGEGVKSLLHFISERSTSVRQVLLRGLSTCKQLLAAEDTAYFLAISQWPGQKPVPFIPVLDAGFEVWSKKVISNMWKFDVLTNVNDLRIPCGLQKILRPSSTALTPRTHIQQTMSISAHFHWLFWPHLYKTACFHCFKLFWAVLGSHTRVFAPSRSHSCKMVNGEGRTCQGPWQHQKGSYPATSQAQI